MHDELLPLFPLNVVLLPRNPLPLHVFEERYKEMIGEALESGAEFGVVLAAEGGIVNAGCTAAVEQVLQRYGDGRMDILTIGRRRFQIVSLNEERAFLRGEVEYFDDVDDFAPPDLRTRALGALREMQPEAEAPDQESPWLSFDLAREVNDLPFRQQLLMCRSEADRLRMLVQFLPVQKVRDEYVERIKVLAPRNGHGKHGPGAGKGE